jgi:hypothetical protein
VELAICTEGTHSEATSEKLAKLAATEGIFKEIGTLNLPVNLLIFFFNFQVQFYLFISLFQSLFIFIYLFIFSCFFSHSH